jgi:5'-nucleotidase
MKKSETQHSRTYDGAAVDLTTDEAKELLRGDPLRVGVSTRALFDLREEHDIFNDKGVDAYAEYQRENESVLLRPGIAFPLVSKLLMLNEQGAPPFVEVIVLSKNSPDLSLRALASAEHHKLPITLGSFTSGRPLAPYLTAWNIDLFITASMNDARQAVSQGVGAVHLSNSRPPLYGPPTGELNVAFDGDAVIFSADSDNIYKTTGLTQFDNALIPMHPGPLGAFFTKLSFLRSAHVDAAGRSKVRIAVVTARNAPAHARVVHTLRQWRTPADEVHFVGRNTKAPFLQAFGADIFFDDQIGHIEKAERVVPSGQVPGPHDDGRLLLVSD